MQLAYICSCGLIALAVSASSVAAQEVLDLVKAARERRPPPPGARLSGSGVVVGGSGIVRPRLPLEATLLSVAPRDLEAGGEFTYELGLKNKGSDDFPIPWSPERIEEKNWPVVEALISLRDVSDENHAFGVMGFCGSLGVRESIKTLRPGEQVVVRAGGRFMGSTTEWGTFVSSLPRTITLRARLAFVTSWSHENPALLLNPPLFQNPIPVTSVNQLAVEVGRPRKR
jgi:hypothetical protein